MFGVREIYQRCTETVYFVTFSLRLSFRFSLSLRVTFSFSFSLSLPFSFSLGLGLRLSLRPAHRGHREVIAPAGAIAPGPNALHAGTSVLINLDLVDRQFRQITVDQPLTDGHEHLIRRDAQGLARAFHVIIDVFKLDLAH